MTTQSHGAATPRPQLFKLPGLARLTRKRTPRATLSRRELRELVAAMVD